jgi:uncharacterized protein YggL (DUF469 family)
MVDKHSVNEKLDHFMGECKKAVDLHYDGIRNSHDAFITGLRGLEKVRLELEEEAKLKEK